MFPLIVYLARLLLTCLLVLLLHSLLTPANLFVFGMRKFLKTTSNRFPFPTGLTRVLASSKMVNLQYIRNWQIPSMTEFVILESDVLAV